MDPDPARSLRKLRVVDTSELGSPYPKASLLLRFGARVLDVAIAWGLFWVAGRAGAVMALLFLLFADGLFNGQSPGKKLCGVKVMHLPTQSAARHRDSVLRNAPFALIVLLGMMPSPLGFPAFGAGLLALGGIEAFRVYRDPLGRRLGDAWAQTQVVDGKVVAGATVAPRQTRSPEPERVMRSVRTG